MFQMKYETAPIELKMVASASITCSQNLELEKRSTYATRAPATSAG